MVGLLLLRAGACFGASTTGRIVVLGDSITAGFGLDRSQAYPALLQHKVRENGLSFEVVNAGLSGDTTAGGLRRVQWALGAGASVCVVALGGNDGLRGVPVEQTESNLEGIIRAVRGNNPETVVIVAGMQMPLNFGREFREAFAAIFPRVAERCRTLLVPFLLEGVGGVPEMNQDDQIHPNAAGQRRVAENVWKVLEAGIKQVR
jgi:acyl-CoA thioesterase-1